MSQLTTVSDRVHRNRGLRLRGLTLIELLVVVSVVALLLSVLLPSLGSARGQARAALCASNLRQLMLAVHLYAHDHQDQACPGAADALSNLHRWHGTRSALGDPFDPREGPLVPYLGPDGEIRRCPVFRGYVTDSPVAFELGNGGYGYNNAFVGRLLRLVAGDRYVVDSDTVGTPLVRLRNPAETLIFADTAFAADGMIEYSFAEPRFLPTNGFRADPSIHFRHRGAANVAWCDGHVDRRRHSFTWSSGFYPDHPAEHAIGWFGQSDDNRFFDLR